MDDPSLMSAVELTRALRRRDVSSRELLEVFLRRIEADEGGVNAVVTVDEQSAPLGPTPWMRPWCAVRSADLCAGCR
ncbi:MAG: hypothetical protein WCG47_03800 [Dermatophilaceae bacterium]